MSKATIVEGVPAVTEVVEVSPAVPETVVLELTREEALAVYKLVNGSARAIGLFSGFTADDDRKTYKVFQSLFDIGFRLHQ